MYIEKEDREWFECKLQLVGGSNYLSSLLVRIFVDHQLAITIASNVGEGHVP